MGQADRPPALGRAARDDSGLGGSVTLSQSLASRSNIRAHRAALAARAHRAETNTTQHGGLQLVVIQADADSYHLHRAWHRATESTTDAAA